MSVLDSIDSLITHEDVVVTRRAKVTYVDGIKVEAAPTTLLIDVVLQPAFNLSRVIGGADLRAQVDNQHVNDVQQIHTRTKLYARSKKFEPDVLTLDADGDGDDDWTVVRVENTWDLDGEVHCHAVISRQTGGAA